MCHLERRTFLQWDCLIAGAAENFGTEETESNSSLEKNSLRGASYFIRFTVRRVMSRMMRWFLPSMRLTLGTWRGYYETRMKDFIW